MSSDTLSILSSLQLNDYTSVAAMTVVVYDYVLTFASESIFGWVNYVLTDTTSNDASSQKRPWSWVSTLFIVVRYLGFLAAM
ncbi:hypothetical protein PAXINDRAFT_11019 [Paxillus involutus ATCC 200175]|nr:hypothetical protein PAXINDRAFT_11019 [Paxillus involutus ATCC 200175]